MAVPKGMTEEIYDLYAGRLGFSALGMQGIGNEAADRVTNPKAKEIWARFEHLAKTNKDVANAAIDAYQKNPNEYASVIYSLAGNMDLNPSFAEKFVSGLEQDPKMAPSVFSNYARELDRGTLGDYIHLVMTGSRPTSPIEDKSETPQDELDTFLAKQGNEKFRDLVDKNQLRPLMKEEIGKNKSLMKSLYDPGQMAHYLDVLKKNEGSTLDVRQTAFMKAFAPSTIDMGGSLIKAFGEGGEGLKGLLGSMEGLMKGLPPELGNMLSGVFREVESIFNGVGQLAMAYQKGADRQKALLASMDPKAGVAYAASHAGITKADPVYQAETAMANVELAKSNIPQLARQGTNYLMSLGCSPDQIEPLKKGEAGIAAVDVSRDSKTGKVSFNPTIVGGSEWKIIDNIRTANQRAKQEETGKTSAEANTPQEQRKKPTDSAPALAPAETAAT